MFLIKFIIFTIATFSFFNACGDSNSQAPKDKTDAPPASEGQNIISPPIVITEGPKVTTPLVQSNKGVTSSLEVEEQQGPPVPPTYFLTPEADTDVTTEEAVGESDKEDQGWFFSFTCEYFNLLCLELDPADSSPATDTDTQNLGNELIVDKIRLEGDVNLGNSFPENTNPTPLDQIQTPNTSGDDLDVTGMLDETSSFACEHFNLRCPEGEDSIDLGLDELLLSQISQKMFKAESQTDTLSYLSFNYNLKKSLMTIKSKSFSQKGTPISLCSITPFSSEKGEVSDVKAYKDQEDLVLEFKIIGKDSFKKIFKESVQFSIRFQEAGQSLQLINLTLNKAGAEPSVWIEVPPKSTRKITYIDSTEGRQTEIPRIRCTL